MPLPFDCYFAAEVDDCARLEKILHQIFSESRINPKREFTRVDPEKVVLAIRIGSFREVTPGVVDMDPEEKEARDRVRARRPRLRLDALGINPGDAIYFSRDESITATVAPGGKVQYKGATLSLSAAALEVFHELGYGTTAASGSEYWMFDDELLDERRRRMEAETFDEAPGGVA